MEPKVGQTWVRKRKSLLADACSCVFCQLPIGGTVQVLSLRYGYVQISINGCPYGTIAIMELRADFEHYPE